MALSRFCEPFLFSRTRKTVRSLKKKRSEIIGARRSSCSRHFQGAFLGGGYPGLKPCMCTARYRVLPRSSSSSSSFSTSLDAGNAPIANNVQRSRTRTRTTTRTRTRTIGGGAHTIQPTPLQQLARLESSIGFRPAGDTRRIRMPLY
jgi:hypothetical protein